MHKAEPSAKIHSDRSPDRKGLPHTWIPLPYGRGSDWSRAWRAARTSSFVVTPPGRHEQLMPLLHPVVRCFLGDDHVLYVTLAQARRRDPQEARLLLQLLDIVRPA